MANSKKQAAASQLTIIRRYAISRGQMSGCICNVVRSEKTVKGQQISHDYQVWQYRDGHYSCDCPAKTPLCKHIDLVVASEMRRCDYVAPVQPRRLSVIAAIPAEEIAKIAAIAEQAKAEKQVAREQHQAELAAAKIAPNYEVRGTLNGSRAFFLPMSWAEIEAERETTRNHRKAS